MWGNDPIENSMEFKGQAINMPPLFKGEKYDL